MCWDLTLWTSLDRKTIFFAAVAAGALYAASDEIHQLFVQERSGQLSDVLIDTAGVILGAFFVTLLYKKKRAGSTSNIT